MYKMVNGKPVKMTAEEVTKYDKERKERLEAQDKPTMEDRMIKVEHEVEDLSFVITGEVKTNAQR